MSLFYLVTNYNNAFLFTILKNFKLKVSSIGTFNKRKGRKEKIILQNGFGRSSLYFAIFLHSKKDGLYTPCMYNVH